jgi:hypothetical protein
VQPHTGAAFADDRGVVPGEEEALSAAKLRADDDLQMNERTVVEFDLDAVVDELADGVPPGESGTYSGMDSGENVCVVGCSKLPLAMTTVAFMRRRRLVGMVMVVLALSGCGLTMPTDPDGTLDSVRGGTLHVGLSPNGDFTVVEDDETYSGSEVDIIEGFADSLDSTIDWTMGSEEALVRGLEDGTIDVVIAGLTDETPWVDKAGVTRAYSEVTANDGSTHKMVMLVPLGENAFLTELETYLTEYGEQAE